MSKRKLFVTSRDIAQRLGISAASVSLALNNRPGVSAGTRARVLEEARNAGLLSERENEKRRKILFLEYRKNGQGSNQSYFSQTFSSVIEGVERQARCKECELSILTADAENFEEVTGSIDRRGTAGLLVLATEMEEEQILLLDRLRLPMVVLDNYCERVDLNCVMLNNEQGVELAISHLVSRGHERIGYIHVEGDAVNFRERYFGFRRAMELHSLPIREEDIIRFSTLYGGEAVFWELKKKMEGRHQMPTAFFADNDIIAVYAIKVLRELGFRIPEDVSVVGFDDIPIAGLVEPPLTSVSTSKQELGNCAVNQLVNLMDGQVDGVQKTAIKTRLIERKSVRDMGGRQRSGTGGKK